MPQLDRTFETFQVPNTKISIHHKICLSTSFNNYIPLSTSYFDLIFDEVQVLPEFVKFIKSAVGKNGMFSSQCWTRHFGSCSYLGERAKSSQSIPSPSEGPHEHCQWYYCQHISHMYLQFVLRLYNRLGCIDTSDDTDLNKIFFKSTST